MKLFTYFLCATALLCGLATAETPKLINYQGRLTTPGGAPVADAVYTVTFTIYDDPSAGIAIWTETQNVSTLDGQFAVLLGSVTPVSDAVFDAIDRYLGIQVGADPEMTPRLRLGSVPYAHRISTIDGATGGSLIGHLELQNSTLFNGNILKGDSLFLHNTGSNNTFLGRNAGNQAITGADNTGVGTHALRNIAIGSNNTGFGQEALRSTTDGQNNTAVGTRALAANTTGNDNTATGVISMRFNTTGSSNSAHGHGSLHSNTTGNSNTAVGAGALFSSDIASNNTALGFTALLFTTSGEQNTAAGAEALQNNTTGIDNTAHGYGALRSSTTGVRNTAVGSGALEDNATASFSTAVGWAALANNTFGTSNTAVGAEALTTNTSGGTNTAVGQAALKDNTTGVANTALGRAALNQNTSGQQNTAVGNLSLQANMTGSFNTAIGENANVGAGNLTNATAIGWGAVVPTSNTIQLGNASITSLRCQVGLTIVSDSAAKENFQPVDGEAVLEKLTDLSVQSWNYKGHDPEQFRHYGPVAQEFYAAFGDDGVGRVGSPTTINSQDLDGVMLIAIQTLEKRTAEVAQVKIENEALKAKLVQLEAKLNKLMEASSPGSSELGLK